MGNWELGMGNCSWGMGGTTCRDAIYRVLANVETRFIASYSTGSGKWIIIQQITANNQQPTVNA
ncbi:MAG: hypothetical protein KME64_20830 [Scytonematopsis contorta HA4267-MV1]|jgi:hypothetical protein|nr:hypothetical protein [Scytonematopsis contorta HA4267-MV1]